MIVDDGPMVAEFNHGKDVPIGLFNAILKRTGLK
jgi:hypothetical protein